MHVFKFGGASISDVPRMQQVGRIIHEHAPASTLVIISAMGKTTNALEQVAEAFFAGKKQEALNQFEAIKQSHLLIANELMATTDAPGNVPAEALRDIFTEVEWLLHDKPVRDYDYYYDQIVCTGELMSTTIMSHYFQHSGLHAAWVDVRDILRTNDHFREAGIDWQYTAEQVNRQLKPLLQQHAIVVTQGFIGSTDENESTTLGREGSDFTAAVFANLLDAERQTIWKDVEGVMNADPRQFPSAQYIRELNYTEVIEMAFYGAQVIHHKTIKPLQNKSIPLHVRCFLQPELPGTVIHNHAVKNLPPIIVRKTNQVLLQLDSIDFSFVEEKLVPQLHQWMQAFRLSPNLFQHSAIRIYVCLDQKEEKLEKLALAASATAEVRLQKGLTLLTIRHYTEALIQELSANHQIVLQQKTPETIQLLLQES
jgi:aspartate kinase